ncbi:MAG: hypothetical protein KDA65_09855 [Planctomycetaceae bacterium]|nr:hypothetical protein [Planctomycetaceae bacterium]
MTTSGKILVVIVILAGITGLFLMAKMTGIHSSHIQAYENASKELEAASKQNSDRKLKLDQAQQEHDRVIKPWYQNWDNVNTISNGDGSITLDAGKEQGIPVPSGDVPVELYAFRIDPTDATKSHFVKAFKVTDVQANQSTATALGYKTADEIAEWQSGNWRFWKMIPNSKYSLLNTLDTRRAEADLTLASKERHVDKQKELVTHAQKMLDNRHLELDGNPNFNGDENLPIEIRIGIIKAIEQTRNDQLNVSFEVDKLRREIKQTTDEINQLLEENKELVSRLPQ